MNLCLLRKKIIFILFLFPLLGNNTTNAQCDSSLWAHVYHSYRLAVNTQCMTATGFVYSLIYEADGDIHIRLTVDSPFTYMLNAVNFSGQYGKLVCEPICATTCTQADAIASCAGFTNTVFIPSVGEHVAVTGSYCTDNDHGWNEIHPVTKIVIQPLAAPVAPDVPFTGVTVFPNPASDHIVFKLNELPRTPVHITIQDKLGRLAGQYQLLTTSTLDVTTTYLPEGTYVFHVEQGDKYVQKGSFVVMH